MSRPAEPILAQLGRNLPAARRLARITVAALSLGLVVAGVLGYPLAPALLAAVLLLDGAALWRFPEAWLVVVPALLPSFDLALWTGRLAIEEPDLFVLVTIGVLVLRAPPRRADFALGGGRGTAVALAIVAASVGSCAGSCCRGRRAAPACSSSTGERGALAKDWRSRCAAPFLRRARRITRMRRGLSPPGWQRGSPAWWARRSTSASSSRACRISRRLIASSRLFPTCIWAAVMSASTWCWRCRSFPVAGAAGPGRARLPPRRCRGRGLHVGGHLRRACLWQRGLIERRPAGRLDRGFARRDRHRSAAFAVPVALLCGSPASSPIPPAVRARWKSPGGSRARSGVARGIVERGPRCAPPGVAAALLGSGTALMRACCAR